MQPSHYSDHHLGNRHHQSSLCLQVKKEVHTATSHQQLGCEHSCMHRYTHIQLQWMCLCAQCAWEWILYTPILIVLILIFRIIVLIQDHWSPTRSREKTTQSSCWETMNQTGWHISTVCLQRVGDISENRRKHFPCSSYVSHLMEQSQQHIFCFSSHGHFCLPLYTLNRSNTTLISILGRGNKHILCLMILNNVQQQHIGRRNLIELKI